MATDRNSSRFYIFFTSTCVISDIWTICDLRLYVAGQELKNLTF